MLEWMKNACLSLAFGFLVYKKNAFYQFAVAHSLCIRDWETKPTAKRQKIGCINSRSGKKIWKWTFLYLIFSLLCIGLCLFSFETAFCKTLLLLFSPCQVNSCLRRTITWTHLIFSSLKMVTFLLITSSLVFFIHPISKGY